MWSTFSHSFSSLHRCCCQVTGAAFRRGRGTCGPRSGTGSPPCSAAADKGSRARHGAALHYHRGAHGHADPRLAGGRVVDGVHWRFVSPSFRCNAHHKQQRAATQGAGRSGSRARHGAALDRDRGAHGHAEPGLARRRVVDGVRWCFVSLSFRCHAHHKSTEGKHARCGACARLCTIAGAHMDMRSQGLLGVGWWMACIGVL